MDSSSFLVGLIIGGVTLLVTIFGIWFALKSDPQERNVTLRDGKIVVVTYIVTCLIVYFFFSTFLTQKENELAKTQTGILATQTAISDAETPLAATLEALRVEQAILATQQAKQFLPTPTGQTTP